MTVYITKVWSFKAPVGPLQFSLEGRRNSARDILRHGDMVVWVGTKGGPTAESDQGRLLGITETSTEPVMSLDFDFRTRPEDYDENRKYRWPYGLLNRRAWQLVDRPLLTEISQRQFGRDSASGIVALSEAEAAKVLSLRRETVPMLEPRAPARARLDGIEAARRRTSPPPMTTRRGVMHMREAPAYTYAFEIKGARSFAFKIGWAFDYKIRARQFNQAAMPELGGLHYKPALDNLWDTAREAYRMEQRLLGQFESKRHAQNHEIICDVKLEDLTSVWARLLGV